MADKCSLGSHGTDHKNLDIRFLMKNSVHNSMNVATTIVVMILLIIATITEKHVKSQTLRNTKR